MLSAATYVFENASDAGFSIIGWITTLRYHEMHKLLRRKAFEAEMQALCEIVEKLADSRPDTAAHPAELSGQTIRNERHIEDTDKSDFVLMEPADNPQDAPRLGTVLDSCNEYKAFFPDHPPGRNGLHQIADRLYAMLGIDGGLFRTAQTVLGKEQASTVARIKSPGAYLRGILKRAEAGRFNMQGMLRAAKLSADNFCFS